MSNIHSWQPGKKASGGNNMINTGVNLDLTVNTFGSYNLDDLFAVEKSGESLKRL